MGRSFDYIATFALAWLDHPTGSLWGLSTKWERVKMGITNGRIEPQKNCKHVVFIADVSCAHDFSE